MSQIEIRSADAASFAIAAEWAAAEGWNPGLDDLEAFFAADPGGFLLGYAAGEPVACISVVRYGDAFGFLGFYIVRPDWRGRGAGLAIWRAGLERLAGRTVGLDGVVAQQANYRRSGFVLTGRNIRFTGPAGSSAPRGDEDPALTALTPKTLPALATFDRDHFPASERRFSAAGPHR
ncbi:MAG: GNAT family N-acetyltransferase, partial [Pseudomonadota bacterium]